MSTNTSRSSSILSNESHILGQFILFTPRTSACTSARCSASVPWECIIFFSSTFHPGRKCRRKGWKDRGGEEEGRQAEEGREEEKKGRKTRQLTLFASQQQIKSKYFGWNFFQNSLMNFPYNLIGMKVTTQEAGSNLDKPYLVHRAFFLILRMTFLAKMNSNSEQVQGDGEEFFFISSMSKALKEHCSGLMLKNLLINKIYFVQAN